MNMISHYNAKLAAITSIPDEKIFRCDCMPVHVYVQEAENLHYWCLHDREKLIANGLDRALVADLPARIDALREAQARLGNYESRNMRLEELWREKFRGACGLRKELVRAMKFAFRKDRAVLSWIKRSAGGNSHADVIQSLRNLSVFAAEHADFLRGANFDLPGLHAAGNMSADLTYLLAEVRSLKASCAAKLKIRNQAYTYLREAISEIKSHANFVLCSDPHRLKGYTSSHIRRKNRKSRSRIA